MVTVERTNMQKSNIAIVFLISRLSKARIGKTIKMKLNLRKKLVLCLHIYQFCINQEIGGLNNSQLAQ